MADSVKASQADSAAAAAPLLPVVSASSAAEEKDREGGEKLLTEMSDAELMKFVSLDVTRASVDD